MILFPSLTTAECSASYSLSEFLQGLGVEQQAELDCEWLQVASGQS